MLWRRRESRPLVSGQAAAAAAQQPPAVQKRNGPVIWPTQPQTTPPPGTVLWRRQSPAAPPFTSKGAAQQTVPSASSGAAQGNGRQPGRSPSVQSGSSARLKGRSPSAAGSKGTEQQPRSRAIEELRNGSELQREQILGAELLAAEPNGREGIHGASASAPGMQCCRSDCMNTNPGAATSGKKSVVQRRCNTIKIARFGPVRITERLRVDHVWTSHMQSF